jgi:selenocysteine-specific elongation factor
VLGSRTIEPGAQALVQLRLEHPVAAGRGDRLVLRSYSPATTIAGLHVLDPLPPKRRRADLGAVQRIRDAKDDPGQVASLFVEEAGVAGITRAALAARLTVPEDRVADLCRGQAEVAPLGQGLAAFMSRAALDRLGAEVTAAIDQYHRENPLRGAMPREEVRRRVFAFAPEPAFPHVLGELQQAGVLRVESDAVARAGHAVRLTREEAEARDALVRSALQGGLTGVVVGEAARALGRDPRLLERVAQRLGEEGLLLRVGEGFLVHRDVLESLKADVRRRWPPGTRLDVGEFKTMTGLTRKFVIPLLEFLDRERITRRAGSDRQVVA